MRWIAYFNLVLMAAIIAVTAFFLMAPKPTILTLPPTPKTSSELPKSPFSQSEVAYEKIGMELNWVEPKMQLPDLRNELVYRGKNARPDLKKGCYRLSIRGTEDGLDSEILSFSTGVPIYLVYESHYLSSRGSGRGSYRFSPNNAPTPLWIELKSSQPGTRNPLQVAVSMLDERGQLVSTPEEWSHFHLHEGGAPPGPSIGWELPSETGPFRVDSTLLVRQRARWIGEDCFLKLHGGTEFAHTDGKERIDFQGGDKRYSCFAGLGDFMIWKEGRWHTPKEGEVTAPYPLLVVKKIDQKILSLELWHPQGLGKTGLTLIRARDIGEGINLADEFKFVGAKTWAQFIVENRDQKRFTLKPNDWLVKTEEGWKTIETPEQIDAYVNGEISGPLFILDKMERQSGRQVLCGHVFNQSRTHFEQVELSSSSSDTSLANFYRTVPEVATISRDNIRGE